MSILVIHVGAQKCGSTTIQNAIDNLVRTDSSQKLKFRIFPPDLAVRMHQQFKAIPDHELDIQFAEICKDDVCLVLSNEILGNYPDVVAKLVERASKKIPELTVVIIGYTRSQYSYYLSEYKQWYFRAKGRLRADINFFQKNDLSYEIFLPHERRMFVNSVMSFEEQRQGDWYEYYQSLEKAILAFSGNVIIKSSHIPTVDFNYSLIGDFIRKVGVGDIEEVSLSGLPSRSNPSFNPLLCESVALHICNDSLDSSFLPGPHESNDLIQKASGLFRLEQNLLGKLPGSADLLEVAKATIAQNFAVSNEKYCRKYGVNSLYFSQEQGQCDLSSIGSRKKLFDFARKIHDCRNLDDVRKYENKLICELDQVAYIFEKAN